VSGGEAFSQKEEPTMTSRILWRPIQSALTTVVRTTLVALGLVLFLPPQLASAATTYEWKGQGDGHAWGDEKNWAPNGNPQDGDSIIVSGNWVITGVPSISLETFSLTGNEMPGNSGPVLIGANSTITTKVLNWSGRGRLAASLVVNRLGQLSNITAPGPILDNSATALGNPPVTFTNNGLVTQTGTFGLTPGPGSGARIVNEGTWNAVGETTISSGSCCLASTATIDNHGTISVAGKLVLDHARFVAERNSELRGLPGTLEVRGGLALLNGPWNIGGGAKLQLTFDALANIGGTTRIGGEIQQEHHSDISGTGVFDGTGKYRWLGGQILGNLTIGSSLTGVIEGPATPVREVSSGIGAGVLTVEGKVDQTSDVLQNGKIVNKGTWHLPADTNATIGAGSLGTPPRGFRNAGIVNVDSGAALSLKLLELSNPTDKGVIKGGGTVSLSGGIHQLSDGAAIQGPGTTLELIDAAEVHGTGTLKLDQARVEINNAKLWNTFTIGGDGKTILQRGAILGDLTTGPDVDLFLVEPGRIDLDGATGEGILRTKGDVRQNRPEAISLIADARIVNSGTWLIDQASFQGGGGRFVNEGRVAVDGAAKFEFVRFVNTEKVTIHDDATMEFSGFSPRATDGFIDLRGGRIVTALPLVLSGGPLSGTLVGAGQIQGDVTNAGTVGIGEGSRPGTMVVSGVYRQLKAGTLFLDVFPSNYDKIFVGALELDGTLGLDKAGSAPLQPTDKIPLVATDSRMGRFGKVSGLNALGGGWRVRYTTTDVRLRHR
jgi:hypothetical protein